MRSFFSKQYSLWVKNTDDGRLKRALRREDGEVNEMINWSKQGTPSAKMEKVDIIDFDYSLKSNEFKIKK